MLSSLPALYVSVKVVECVAGPVHVGVMSMIDACVEAASPTRGGRGAS